MAQSVGSDFGSGHDLKVRESSPESGSVPTAQSLELLRIPCLPLSLCHSPTHASLSLSLSLSLSISLSLTKVNEKKTLKNK